MAEQGRVIEYKISAVDQATGVFQKAADNMRRIAKTTESVELTPLRRVQRSAEQQGLRNELARRAKAEREAVRKERVLFLADEHQFGTRLAQERARQRRIMAQGGTGLDQIKSIFGPRGPVKGIAELFIGGGAIAGVGFITRGIANATDETRKLVEQFREGEITAEQLKIRLFEQIPILGNIFRAVGNIHEMVTGQEAAARALVRAEQNLQVVTQKRLEIQKELEQSHRETQNIIRDINRELQLRSLPEPRRSLAEQRFRESDARLKAEETATENILKNRQGINEQISAMNRHLNQLEVERERLGKRIIFEEEAGVRPDDPGLIELRRSWKEVGATIQNINDAMIRETGKARDEQQRIEKDRNDTLAAIVKKGSSDRREILAKGGRELIDIMRKTWDRMIEISAEKQKQEREREVEHSQSLTRLHRESRLDPLLRRLRGFGAGGDRNIEPFQRNTFAAQQLSPLQRPIDTTRPALDSIRAAAEKQNKTSGEILDAVRDILNEFIPFARTQSGGVI